MIDQLALRRIQLAEQTMVARKALATTTERLGEFDNVQLDVRPPGLRGVAIVDAALAHKDEPSLTLTLGGDELITVRPGGIVTLVGSTGGGKTSAALSMAVEHAHDVGPAIVVSLELTGDEAGARALGIHAVILRRASDL